MRIRKNARRIVHEGGARASFITCQLNRSPWDVDDIFLTQAGWDNEALFGGNSIPVSDRVRIEESMELSFEYVKKTQDNKNNDNKKNGGEDEEIGVAATNIGVVVATRMRRNALLFGNGGDNPSSKPFPAAPVPPKKQAVAASSLTQSKKRGRPARKPAPPGSGNSNSNSNPYEFYYYSGFGPSWSKRRDGNTSNTNNSKCNKDDGEYMDQDAMIMAANGNATVESSTTPGCSSTTRVSISDEEEFFDDDENKSDSKVNDGLISGSGGGADQDTLFRDEFYDDDEEDDEDYYGGGIRRARKPIKARSLKSFM